MQLIRLYVPTKPIQGWPLDAPPAGLLLLLLDEKLEVRTWAYQQVALYTTTPMPAEQFLTSHQEVLSNATNVITSLTPNNILQPWGSEFSFPSSPDLLWPGYCTILRFVPVKWMKPSATFKIDLRKIVIVHLSDTADREFL
jgi:senataxin